VRIRRVGLNRESVGKGANAELRGELDGSASGDRIEPTGAEQERGSGVPRRSLIRTGLVGLGGLAAPQLLPVTVGVAEAAPSDPNAGHKVTPDPIKPRIQFGDVAVEIVDFSTPPPTKQTPSRANLNFVYHAGDGSGRLFAADSRGKIWEVDTHTGAARLFLDMRKARQGALIINFRDQGLRSFAFHPDFANPIAAGYRKLYTISVETVASRKSGVVVFSGPFPVKTDCVLAEWSVGPGVPQVVDPLSRREILRIAEWGAEHNADTIMFDPNAQSGSPAYGKMFITTGDGGNHPKPPDPYHQAQDPARALGKLLRINPLKQANGAAYGVPADNPFVGKAGYLPEIWALGFRHPQNLSFDRGGTGAMIVTDIGQSNIEEVNLGVRGGNYGWPYREGTFVTDTVTGYPLYGLPPDDAKYGYIYPVAQYDHVDATTSLGKAAIAGGYVYRGTAVPALAGRYLFGDIVRGRVFHVAVADLKLGSQATIQELRLLRHGTPVTLLDLVGPSSPPGRVDLRFGQDESGEVYIVTKQDGKIRKLAAAAS
jgi:glucose/arabinose dehydrogenase